MSMGKLPGSDKYDEFDGEGGVFAEINITPLTDIFLVLLIIFMVTSSALVEQGSSGTAGVKVNLPKGGATDQATTAADLVVAVLLDGRTVLAGKVLSQDDLKAGFLEAYKKNPETQVIVQADSGVPHGKVVEVMELAKGIGLQHLAIATRAE